MRHYARILTLTIILAGCIWLPGALGAPTPQEVISLVQAKYDTTGTFQARFRQESRLQSQTGPGDTAEGLVYFQKPCRMRWLYETPPEQKKEVISDGNQVWLYMPQDRLVMLYPLKTVLRSDLVMRFFSGIGQLSQEFDLSWRRPPESGAAWVIDLVPKKETPELKRLTLTINPKTHLVEKLEFTNSLGEETSFTFSRVRLQVKLKPDFFTFKPPPGVKVVEDPLR